MEAVDGESFEGTGSARRAALQIQQLRVQSPAKLLRTLILRSPGTGSLLRRHYEERFYGATFDAINFASRARARELAKPLDPAQELAVETLRREGLHRTHVADLVQSPSLVMDVRKAAETLLERPHVKRQIERRWSTSGVKWYLVRGLGLRGPLDLPDAVARLLLNERVLAVVNEYLGLCARLHYADLWYSFPVHDGEPSISAEHWHRDHEDRSLVKVALFLDDVTPESGPLCYLRRSHALGPLADLHPARPPEGVRPAPEDMEAMVSLGQVEVCTGGAGDLVFFDGSGMHFGGRARGRPRLVLTATFVSDAALDGYTYRVSDATAASLSEAGRFALRLS